MKLPGSSLARFAPALALVALAFPLAGCFGDSDEPEVATVDVDDETEDERERVERHDDEGPVEPVWIDSEGNQRPEGGTLPTIPDRWEPEPTLPEDPEIALPEGPDELYQLVAANVAEALSTPRPSEDLRPDSGLSQQERSKLVTAYNRAKDSWREAAWVVSKAGVAYRDATSPEERDNRVLAWAGLARSELSSMQTASDADVSRRVAVDLLREYVEQAPEADDLLPDSLGRLGVMLLQLGSEARVAEGVDHLERAAQLMVDRDRRAEAGRTLFYLMSTLVNEGEEARALQVARKLGTANGDFGPSTDSMRRLTRRAMIHPGAEMPILPAVNDADGEPIDLTAHRGKFVLLHYFQAGLPTGTAAEWTEIESVIAPLRRSFPDKLQVIGVSMDFEMPQAMFEQRVADWDEWGRDGTPHDGKLETVRGIIEAKGVDWPWYWDGQWMQNTLTAAVGLPANEPFAILIDPQGRIVFRGFPDEQLTEAAETALNDA